MRLDVHVMPICSIGASVASGVVLVLRLCVWVAGIMIPNAKPQYKSNTTYNGSTNRAYGHNMNIQTHAATPPKIE